MTKKPRSTWRLWPLFGGCAVLGLWLVSAAANYHAGISISDDPMISDILGIASVCADVMKAVALFIITAAIVNKRWIVAGCATVVLVLCGAWSVRSAMHFASSALTTKAAERTLSHSLQKADLDLLAIKTQRAGFLSQQSVTVDVKNRYARADALQANERSSVEFSSLVRDIEAQKKAIKKAGVATAGDPIAALFKLEDRTVILATALFFAALLEVVSGFGFWLIAQSRSPRIETLKSAYVVQPVVLQEPAPILAVSSPDGDPRPGAAIPVIDKEIRYEEPQETAPDNVVSIRKAQKAGLRSIVSEHFEPGTANDRMLLRAVVDQINAQLPKSRRIIEPHLVAKHITPVITEDMEWPGISKRKIGGRTYIVGLRPRSIESRKAA